MKRFPSILLIAVILIYLVGCAKIIDTKRETVEVKIVDSYHRSAWVQTISTGKVTTTVPHPEIYRIYVEYDGVEYTVSGSDTYRAYKDKIGETVSATLEINTYDNGTTKKIIVSLGD